MFRPSKAKALLAVIIFLVLPGIFIHGSLLSLTANVSILPALGGLFSVGLIFANIRAGISPLADIEIIWFSFSILASYIIACWLADAYRKSTNK